MKTTNVMAFAHFMTKRTLTRVGTAYNRPYAQMLKYALQDAHRFNKRGELDAKYNEVLAIDERIELEKGVVRNVVRSALKHGLSVSLFDGEEWTVKRAINLGEIMSAIQTTDSDTLRFRKIDDVGTPVGSVFFVYGNQASEVINDWTDNELMNTVLAPALEHCDRLAILGK